MAGPADGQPAKRLGPASAGYSPFTPTGSGRPVQRKAKLWLLFPTNGLPAFIGSFLTRLTNFPFCSSPPRSLSTNRKGYLSCHGGRFSRDRMAGTQGAFRLIVGIVFWTNPLVRCGVRFRLAGF